jgi:hypothetical protein
MYLSIKLNSAAVVTDMEIDYFFGAFCPACSQSLRFALLQDILAFYEGFSGSDIYGGRARRAFLAGKYRFSAQASTENLW